MLWARVLAPNGFALAILNHPPKGAGFCGQIADRNRLDLLIKGWLDLGFETFVMISGRFQNIFFRFFQIFVGFL
jgi:hypothetical protein